MLPTKIWFIWPSDFREDLYKSVNQKQVLPVATIFINRSGRCNLSRGPSIDAKSFGSFGQAVSEEKIFKYRPIRNKNCLWRLCLYMDRDEMCNLYRGLSIDASY
jgi:hypothetical protein